MSDLDQLRELKKRYVHLVKTHGEQVTEFAPFKKALLELNRKHRRAAIRMYSQIISRIEKKMTRAGGRGRRGRGRTRSAGW